MNAHGDMMLYAAAGGPAVEVRLERETVWLTQKQMALLFDTERSVITKHIKNIIQTTELQAVEVCAKNARTAADGKMYATTFYNLDNFSSQTQILMGEWCSWQTKPMREKSDQ